MDWCSRSLTSEKSIKNIGEKGRNNLSSRSNNYYNARNGLLGLFVRYAWDDRGGPCSDDENIKLINWLKSTTIDFKNEDWDFSSETDICTGNEIEVTDGAPSDKNVSKNTNNPNARMTYARVAYNLRKILPVLLDGNDDANTEASGQTFLHIFLIEYLEKTEDFTADTIIRLQRLIEGLMKMSAPFYSNDAHGKTPLHIAATCKNQTIIKIIASRLIDVGARDKYGNTALHIVVDSCVNEELQHRDSYFDVVRTLIAKGADPNGKNHEGVTPVHLAAEKFHIEILQFLADNNANFDERTNADELPLHFACKSSIKLSDTRKTVETIDFLIGNSRVANATDGKGYAPLHHAAVFASVEVVERLIELGAKVNRRTAELQLTPLHLALEADRLDNAKVLVRAGADVEAEAADGSLPVFLAATRGSLDSLRFLIDEGADLSRREAHSGFTLLHFTAWHKERFDLVVERASLDVNSPGSCGVTALSLAALWHSVEVAKSLVARGAKVNFRGDESELSALHIAALQKNADVVELLIESGADVNSRGGVERMTPLHLAAIDSLRWSLGRYPEWVKTRSFIDALGPLATRSEPRRSPEDVVRLLIRGAADVNAKDASGRSPLHLASLHDDGAVTRELLAANARVNVQDQDARLPLHNALTNDKSGALHYLLVFGAEISEPDTVRLVEGSDDALKSLVLEHAVRLKCAGLPIARAYEDLLREPRFADLHDRCRDEVKTLGDAVIDGGLSLYEFVHAGRKRQYLFRHDCEKFYMENQSKFPLCNRLIWAACFEAQHRMAQLDLARIAWYEITNVHLPDVCLECILSHLSNRSLEILAACGQNPEEIELTDSKRVVFKCKLGD